MNFLYVLRGVLAGGLLLICITPDGAAVGSSDRLGDTVDREQTELRRAVTFERNALDATPESLALGIAAHEQRCRFTAGRNPLRPRRNECRLA